MGVWIETLITESLSVRLLVTPYVGVWIETRKVLWRYQLRLVTPYVGVWIETLLILQRTQRCVVTPYVGVWIETNISGAFCSGAPPSLLMWECGLKLLAIVLIFVDSRHSLCGSVD